MVRRKLLAVGALGKRVFDHLLDELVVANFYLVASSTAQFAQYTSGEGFGLAVNVPDSTASSGSGSIYFQISAPQGTEWIGFGQGSRMSGANMFIVYSASSTNVTVSPRLGTGHVEPQLNSDASIFVLEGTGITSDGSMVANVRCDSCLSWSGGSMDATSTSSNWIYAWKNGSPLDTTSTDVSISEHDGTGTLRLDLTSGVGGSSSNPFIAAAENPSATSESGSATASASATATGGASQTGTLTTPATVTPTVSNGVSGPLASSNPSSSGAGQSTSPDNTVRTAHAAIMSLVFVVMFPLAALTIYLPHTQKVRLIHAPLQVISIILMIAGLALGVQLGKQISLLDGYHQVIGYIVFAWMVIVQPALGLGQHLHFRKNGTRSPMGSGHRWLGRIMIALGVVNGGLGFHQTGAVGSRFVPTYAVIVYSAFAVVVFLIYIGVIVFSTFTSKRSDSLPGEKPRPATDGYEMHGRSFESQQRPNA